MQRPNCIRTRPHALHNPPAPTCTLHHPIPAPTLTLSIPPRPHPHILPFRLPHPPCCRRPVRLPADRPEALRTHHHRHVPQEGSDHQGLGRVLSRSIGRAGAARLRILVWAAHRGLRECGHRQCACAGSAGSATCARSAAHTAARTSWLRPASRCGEAVGTCPCRYAGRRGGAFLPSHSPGDSTLSVPASPMLRALVCLCVCLLLCALCRAVQQPYRRLCLWATPQPRRPLPLPCTATVPPAHTARGRGQTQFDLSYAPRKLPAFRFGICFGPLGLRYTYTLHIYMSHVRVQVTHYPGRLGGAVRGFHVSLYFFILFIVFSVFGPLI